MRWLAMRNEEPPQGAARRRRDWTQGELADRLEISRQSVNAIETGRYDPSLPLAFKIADLFGLQIEEIFSKG